MILVCGGRWWGRWDAEKTPDKTRETAAWEIDATYDALDRLHAAKGIALVIHGAAKGADSLGRAWAIARGVDHKPYPAEWERYKHLARNGRGNPAGTIRNAQMLVEGKPHGVVAFPGGTGTGHMVTIAQEAGVPVWQPYGA